MKLFLLRRILLTGALVLAAATTGQAIRTSAMAAEASNPWASIDRTNLTDAIAAIEQASGGEVLEIRFSYRRGVVGYDAVVAKDAVISHVHISAAPSHNVVAIAEADRPAWIVNWILKADMRSIQRAKLSLADAVAKAEQITGAPAVDAGLAKPLTADNAVLAFNVEVIKNGKPQRIVIDAVTGDTVANPDALLDTWSPEEALYRSLPKA